MNQCVWMFPGQGSQNSAMLADVDPKYFQWVNELTGKDYMNQAPDFTNTIDIQLTLLITEMNASALLKAEGLKPQIVAGHSLGAFSAAVAANVLTEKDAITFVYHRASLMASLYPQDYGMGVIIGLTRNEVLDIVESVHSDQWPLYTSNQNEELQLTISGHWQAIDLALASAKNSGAGLAKRLSVPTPSHSLLMQPVADELNHIANTLNFSEPSCGYLGNCTGRLLTTAQEIKEDLINNVVHPVLWLDMMQAAIEQGVQHFIELPPGKNLTKLIERSYPNVKTYAVEQYGILDTVFLFKKWSKEA